MSIFLKENGDSITLDFNPYVINDIVPIQMIKKQNAVLYNYRRRVYLAILKAILIISCIST